MKRFILMFVILFGPQHVKAQSFPSPANIHVTYKPWTVLLGPIVSGNYDNSDNVRNAEAGAEILTFYDEGTVEGMAINGNGPPTKLHLIVCKSVWIGEGINNFYAAEIVYRRYVTLGKLFYYLPRNSSASSDFSPGTDGAAELQVLSGHGYHVVALASDTNWIPELLSPPVTHGSEVGEDLALVVETQAKPDFSKLTLAFVHPELGQVYTTKLGMNKEPAFYCDRTNGIGDPKVIHNMAGADFLSTNGFFVFRPDGTMLVYVEKFAWEDTRLFPYDQTIEKGSLVTKAGISFGDDYSYSTRVGCWDDSSNFCTVVDSNDFSKSELEVYGSVTATGKPLYRIKNEIHPYYRDFYSAYLKNISGRLKDWKSYWNASTVPINLVDHKLSYDEFVSANPILLYQDAFGRWILLTRRAFLPPGLCG